MGLRTHAKRARAGFAWGGMLATDLTSEAPEVDIPVDFFHGIYDSTCSYPLALAPSVK